MTKSEKVEALAKWLNDVCVDWPPIGYSWDGAGSGRRRAQMRTLAREVVDLLDGLKT